MAKALPHADDAVLVFRLADGAERVIDIGSPDWFAWLADHGQPSFLFESRSGSFTARKEGVIVFFSGKYTLSTERHFTAF